LTTCGKLSQYYRLGCSLTVNTKTGKDHTVNVIIITVCSFFDGYGSWKNGL